MPLDPLLQMVHFAEDHGMTPAQMHRAAELREASLPTLREAVAALPSCTLGRIARTAPQGLATLLDGQPGAAGVPGVPGMGDRPYADLSIAMLEPMRDAYQRLVAARGRARAAARGPRAGAGTRDGARAAAQLVYAARAVAKALVSVNQFASNPLEGLKEPASPGAPREKALTDAEVREYCSIVLARSTDLLLDAIAWLLFRVLGARLVEITRIRPTDVVPARPAVTLIGKGGRVREQPAHRPVLLLAMEAMSDRPPAPDGRLLRTGSGRAFDRKAVEGWSTALHQRADWAAGFPIRAHALRHTTARLAKGQGRGEVAAGTLLGHSGATAMRSTLIYTGASTAATAWEDRAMLAELCFGSLDRWPVLPENDILAAVLDIDLPLALPQGPTQP